jgi:hypothetical protein
MQDALYGLLTLGLGDDTPTSALHDNHSQALMLAEQERYGNSGALRELEERINVLRVVNGFMPENHPMKAACLNDLGISFQCQFECLGNNVNLNESITALQQAVCLAPDGHPHKPECLNNLGNLFLRRFEHLGDIADLNEAIIVHRQTVRLTPDSHPHAPVL